MDDVMETPEIDAIATPDAVALPAIDAPETPETPEVKEDGRKVPQALREFFKDPANKEYKERWHQTEAYKAKLPEGMKQLDDLLGLYGETGGKAGYQAKVQELTELATFREDLASGNPQAVTEFAQTSPEGFNKLAPVVAAKWAQTDPEGYQRTMSGVWAGTIAQSAIPLEMKQMEWNLTMLGRYLETIPDVAANPLVQQAFQGMFASHKTMSDWTASFGKAAEAPAKTTPAGDAPNPEREELMRMKNEKFTNDLSAKTDSYRVRQIDTLLKPYLDAQAKNPDLQDLKDMAVDRITSKLHAAMNADPEFRTNQQALMAKRDVDGLDKLYQSRASKLLPEIVAKDGRVLFGSPTVKAAPAAEKKVALPKRDDTPRGAPKKGSFEDIYASL